MILYLLMQLRQIRNKKLNYLSLKRGNNLLLGALRRTIFHCKILCHRLYEKGEQKTSAGERGGLIIITLSFSAAVMQLYAREDNQRHRTAFIQENKGLISGNCQSL